MEKEAGNRQRRTGNLRQTSVLSIVLIVLSCSLSFAYAMNAREYYLGAPFSYIPKLIIKALLVFGASYGLLSAIRYRRIRLLMQAATALQALFALLLIFGQFGYPLPSSWGLEYRDVLDAIAAWLVSLLIGLVAAAAAYNIRAVLLQIGLAILSFLAWLAFQ